MPLIKCPEPDCDRMVSSLADKCPACGAPIASSPGGSVVPASSPNVSSGSPNESVAVSRQSDGNQAIAQLELMVKEAERELLTSDQAQVVARRIAEFKRTAFSSRDAFVEASIANRILVLGDDDVDILKSFNADQRLRIKALYALACERIDGTMLDGLKGFRNLAILDLSYSNGLTWTEMRDAFNCGADLFVLENLYLRRSRRLCSHGLNKWLKQATQLEGLYLDGSTNTQLDGITFADVHRTPSLRTLSIQGCSQLASRDALEARQAILQVLPQLKVIGP